MNVSRSCTATTGSGRPCKAWSIRGTERCLYHTENRVLKETVYTEAWVLKRRIKVLDDRLQSLCHIKDIEKRAQITLNIISLMERLEERLKQLESPKPLTLADKIAATERVK